MTTPWPGKLDGDELRQLMIRYQAADTSAVETLVTRLGPAVIRYLAGPRLTREDSQDLLQDFWLRLHRSRGSYQPSEPVLPWVFAIARHTRIDAYRRKRRLLEHEVGGRGLLEHPSLQPDLNDNELLRLLEDLPASQREVILMLKVSGMTIEEVARAMSSSVGAIKQKAHRAYEKLRMILRDQRSVTT